MIQFSVSTAAFSGPLEILLNLIEERKMSISDVSLAGVTDSYLAYVEKLPSLPIGETAQFVLVASTLLLIKSRALLPTLELSQEERESVEELERRLARYALIRKSARFLRKEWGRTPLLFPRNAPIFSPVFAPGRITLNMTSAAAARLMSILPKLEETAKALVAPVLALEEVIVRLEKRLVEGMRSRFSELTKFASKHEVIVYFLAILELVRGGSVSATQERIWSDITLEAESLAAPKYGAK